MNKSVQDQIDDAFAYEKECAVYDKFPREKLVELCAQLQRMYKKDLFATRTEIRRLRSEIGRLRKLVRTYSGVLKIPDESGVL